MYKMQLKTYWWQSMSYIFDKQTVIVEYEVENDWSTNTQKYTGKSRYKS